MKRPHRLFPLLIALAAALSVSACANAAPPQKWTTSYWVWSNDLAKARAPQPRLDSLYFLSHTIQDPARRVQYAVGWPPIVYLAPDLPAAESYWPVFRFEGQRVPDTDSVAKLLTYVTDLQKLAQRRRLPLAGIQLDIDCPTGSLREYAAFLKSVKKGLPSGMQLSITALLDWFRGGTSIGDVIAEVDEFVPQFYDIAPHSSDQAIAAPIDAARWAPIFNRFEKRYRIGISTFSRAIALNRPTPRQGGHPPYIYSDLSSVDIAANPDFSLSVAHNAANELILTYRATRATHVSYSDFEAGQGVQFLLTTPETIRAAVKSVRQMGGYSAGVIFFRWLSGYERNGIAPEEVLAAAGLTPEKPKAVARVVAKDGNCAAVACADLYLADVTPDAATPTPFSIQSSAAVDYFLPEAPIRTRIADPTHLELTVPAYSGRGDFYLGRIVTSANAQFTLLPTPGRGK